MAKEILGPRNGSAFKWNVRKKHYKGIFILQSPGAGQGGWSREESWDRQGGWDRARGQPCFTLGASTS